jgi:hypothetical protein
MLHILYSFILNAIIHKHESTIRWHMNFVIWIRLFAHLAYYIFLFCMKHPGSGPFWALFELCDLEHLFFVIWIRPIKLFICTERYLLQFFILHEIFWIRTFVAVI